MNIIFLDIDGVLNSTRSFIAANRGRTGGWKTMEEREAATADPVAIGLINKIIEKSKAGIVVSSTHRKFFHNHHDGDCPLQSACYARIDLAAYMEQIGIEGAILGATPNTKHGHRGTEIKTFIDNQIVQPDFTIDRYVIIDDDSDFLDEQFPFFVHTNVNDGFSFANYIKTLKILGVKDDYSHFS